jgi:hypothetical protein
MISTLRKIPWYMAEYITIKQRHSVYEACLKMIQTLATKVRRTSTVANPETERLTPELLHRLVTSAMLCPGFSVVQKHNIASVAGISEDKARQFNQPRFADSWRYQWTLAPKSGMPIDVLEVCSSNLNMASSASATFEIFLIANINSTSGTSPSFALKPTEWFRTWTFRRECRYKE